MSVSSSNRNSETKDDLRCPECLAYFSTISKPMLLPCNHNLCQSCIENLSSVKTPLCPICSMLLKATDKNTFHVNYAFLNWVSKILKTKRIFCLKCNQFFQWVDHYQACPQREFKEAKEIFDDIKRLSAECLEVIKYIDYHRDIITSCKRGVYKLINNNLSNIQKSYSENCKIRWNNCFESIVHVNVEAMKIEIVKFLNAAFPFNTTFKTIECKEWEDLVMKYSSLLDSTSKCTNIVKNKGFDDLNMSYKRNNLGISIQINSRNEMGWRSKSPDIRNKTPKITKSRKPESIIPWYQAKKQLNDWSNPPLNTRQSIASESDIISLSNENVYDDEELGDMRPKINWINNLKISNNIINKQSSRNTNNTNEKILDEIACSIVEGEGKKRIDFTQLLLDSPESHASNSNISSRDFKWFRNEKQSDLSGNHDRYKNNDTEWNNNLNEGVEEDWRIHKIKTLNIKKTNYNIKFQNSLLNSQGIELDNNTTFQFNLWNTSGENGKGVFRANSQNSNRQTIQTIQNDMYNANSDWIKENVFFNAKEFLKNKSNTNNKGILLNNLGALHKVNTENQGSEQRKLLTNPVGFIKLNPTSNWINSSTVIDKLVQHYNIISGINKKLKSYTSQIALRSDQIKTQIEANYNWLSSQIKSSFGLLLKDITYTFKQRHKRYLITFIEHTKTIDLYDVRQQLQERKDFTTWWTKYPPFNKSMRIEYDDCDWVFITGGFDNENKDTKLTAMNTFIILRWSSMSFEIQHQIPNPRGNHASIYFDNKLYLIGGSIEKNIALRDCCSYSLSDRKWEAIPFWNYARENPNVCIYNNMFIYVFCGLEKGWFMETIEFINISNLDLGWTVYQPEDPGMNWVQCENSAVVSMDENKIMIFGGSTKGSKLLHNVYIFNPGNKCIFRGKDMIVNAEFVGGCTIIQNEIIARDWKNLSSTKKLGIHKYDIEKNEWEFSSFS